LKGKTARSPLSWGCDVAAGRALELLAKGRELVEGEEMEQDEEFGQRTYMRLGRRPDAVGQGGVDRLPNIGEDTNVDLTLVSSNIHQTFIDSASSMNNVMLFSYSDKYSMLIHDKCNLFIIYFNNIKSLQSSQKIEKSENKPLTSKYH
jgi:hypothetical protein